MLYLQPNGIFHFTVAEGVVSVWFSGFRCVWGFGKAYSVTLYMVLWEHGTAFKSYLGFLHWKQKLCLHLVRYCFFSVWVGLPLVSHPVCLMDLKSKSVCEKEGKLFLFCRGWGSVAFFWHWPSVGTATAQMYMWSGREESQTVYV